MYISQRCGFGFDFQDAVFHDVADRDDADQLATTGRCGNLPVVITSMMPLMIFRATNDLLERRSLSRRSV